MTHEMQLIEVDVDLYRCKWCKQFPSTNVYECEEGHLSCGPCCIRSHRCRCGLEYTGHENELTYEILCKITRHCRYPGCKQAAGLHDDMCSHELDCPLGNLVCTTCKRVRGCQSELEEHYESAFENSCQTCPNWYAFNRHVLGHLDTKVLHYTSYMIKTPDAPTAMVRFYNIASTSANPKDANSGSICVKLMTLDKEVVDLYYAEVEMWSMDHNGFEDTWHLKVHTWDTEWATIRDNPDDCLYIEHDKVYLYAMGDRISSFQVELVSKKQTQ